MEAPVDSYIDHIYASCSIYGSNEPHRSRRPAAPMPSEPMKVELEPSPDERRERGDRRSWPTRPWDSLRGWNRRREGRRRAEGQVYVDVFKARDGLLLIAIF